MMLEEDREELKRIIAETIKETRPALEKSIAAGIARERGQQRPTKEQIMSIKSRRERQKMIKENMDMFS